MVASAIFITDLSGKSIISRNYRGDISLTSAIERFQKYLAEVNEEAKKPVFYVDVNGDLVADDEVGTTGAGGIHYVYCQVRECSILLILSLLYIPNIINIVVLYHHLLILISFFFLNIYFLYHYSTTTCTYAQSLVETPTSLSSLPTFSDWHPYSKIISVILKKNPSVITLSSYMNFSMKRWITVCLNFSTPQYSDPSLLRKEIACQPIWIRNHP